jgi:hypothetical protein
MTRYTPSKLWQCCGFMAVVALMLALALPARAQDDKDAAATQPKAHDDEQVEGDWGDTPHRERDAHPKASKDKTAPPPWRRGGARHFRDGRRDDQSHDPDRRGRGGPPMGGESMRRTPGRMSDRGGMFGRMMSTDYRKRIMAVLSDIYPELGPRLKEMHKKNPEHVWEGMKRVGPRIHKLVALKESDAEQYGTSIRDLKIGLECERLSKEFRQAKEDGNADRVKQTRRQIAELVKEHFRVRQTLREMELVRLERRLAAARKQLEQRSAKSTELIEARVSDLTGEKDDPEW